MAVPNYNANNISILLSTGGGSFAAAQNYATGSGPVGFIVADFNSDGKLDIAIANHLSNTVSILTGSGTGSFALTQTFGIGIGPQRMISMEIVKPTLR